MLTLSSRDAWELYTLRASLEGLAAELATQFLDDEGRRELKQAFARLAEAGAKRSLFAATVADFALHKTIVALARHRRLAEQYRLVEQQVRMSIASTNALLPDLSSIIDQHQLIVDAMLAGRAREAARLSEVHNHVEGERLREHLQKSEEPRAFSPPAIGSRNAWPRRQEASAERASFQRSRGRTRARPRSFG